MQKRLTSERNIKIDLLRITACFMVVLVHAAAQYWYQLNPAGMTWKTFNFYDTAVRSAALLFFMLSGKLFLEREKAPAFSRLLKNNVAKMLCIYAVWVVLYTMDLLGVSRSIMNPGLVLETAVSFRKYHLWFLPNMIGIYLILPLLFQLKKKKGIYLKYACIAMGVFVTIKTVTIIGSVFGYPVLPNNWYLDFIGYVGYFLTGYYLSTLDTSCMKNRYLFLIYLVIVVVTAILNAEYSAFLGTPTELLYNYFWISTYVEAILIFLMFQNMKEREWMRRGRKVIAYLSECTLGIYLLHVYVLDILKEWYALDTLSFKPIISVWIIAGIVFFICLAVIAILKKIPIINRWVV